MRFGQKCPFFSFLVFQKKSSRENRLDRKESFLDDKSQLLKSPKNRKFKNELVNAYWPKIAIVLIFMFLFLGKSSQEKMFFDVLDRKEGFLDKKNQLLKKSQKLKFSKDVSPSLFAFFSFLFFSENSAREERFLTF